MLDRELPDAQRDEVRSDGESRDVLLSAEARPEVESASDRRYGGRWRLEAIDVLLSEVDKLLLLVPLPCENVSRAQS